MKEIWKDIEGYEGYYQVSNLGRVRSLHRITNIIYDHNKHIDYKIIAGSKNHRGYLYVNLYKNSKVARKAVHRLVAEAFISNPYSKPCVNHKDENKENNCINNLEWVTYKENSNYGTCIERRVKHTDWKEHNKNKRKNVYQYDKELNLIKVWNSASDCKNEGFCQVHVSECCRKERKTHKGYIWSYIELNNYDKENILNELLTKNKPQAKTVYQYDINLNLIKIWESTGECKKGGFCQSKVSSCCRGEINNHKGYIWSYTPLK